MSNKFKLVEELTLLEANNEIKKLIKDIKYYDDMYYNKNKSVISDEEYDKLRLRLNEIENKYPILKTNNSPSNKVGSPIKSNKFAPVKHDTPMLSLSNTFNKDDVYKFIERTKKYLQVDKDTFTSDFCFCFEQKIDGVSLSIIYKDGKLYKASTRGDGYVGEDVTQNVLQIHSIPKYIGNIKGIIEVRGEVYMPLSVFHKLNNNIDKISGNVYTHRINNMEENDNVIKNRCKLYMPISTFNKINNNIGESIGNVYTLRETQVEENNKLLKDRSKLYMPLSMFHKLNNNVDKISGNVYPSTIKNNISNNMQNKRQEKFSTTRNAASGSLRQLDPSVTASRNLMFFAYYINSNNETIKPKTQIEVLELLKELKFNVCEYEYGNTIEEFMNYCEKIKQIRNTLDYEIDGTVLKINSLEIQNKLGFVGRNPRHSVAYKFPASQAITTINKIEINVGRTGKLTPVAILEPVTIQGSTISKVTLHNFKEINSKKLSIGDEIIIERSGDVIPKIVGINKKSNNNIIETPSICPYCGTKLVQIDDSVDIFCPNHYSCPEQAIRYIIYFASRNCFDIDGLGNRQVKELYNMGIIRTPIDLFKLESNIDINILMNKEGWGEVSVNNLLVSINKRREIQLNRFITSLGINEIGGIIATDIANYYNNINNFLNTNVEELQNITKLGEKRINTIIQFIKNDINLNFIKELKKYIKIM